MVLKFARRGGTRTVVDYAGVLIGMLSGTWIFSRIYGGLWRGGSCGNGCFLMGLIC